MDLSKPISYNGVTVAGPTTASGGSAMFGYQFDRVEMSDIDAVGYMEKRALQDGMDAADIYLTGRNLAIDGSVFGTSRGDLWERLATLGQAFNPVIAYNTDTANSGFLALKYYRPTSDTTRWPTATYPNGIPLQMYLRSTRAISYSVDRDVNPGVRGGGIKFRLFMAARDPRSYSQTQTSISLSTASVTATNLGQFPVWPIITFSLSAAGHASARFTYAGSNHVLDIYLNLSTTTTGTFTIDTATRVITDANGALANRLYNTSSTQRFEAIQANTIAHLENATGISSATMSFYQAWLL